LRPPLRQNLHEAHAARDVASKVDAIRIGRIDVDAAPIGLRFGQPHSTHSSASGSNSDDHVGLLPNLMTIAAHPGGTNGGQTGSALERRIYENIFVN